MRTRNKMIFALSIIIVLGASFFLYLNYNKLSTGGDIIELKDINKIEIWRVDENERVNITDAGILEKIKNTLDQLELKSDNNEDLSKAEDRFVLTLYMETEARYDVELYNNTSIKIYDPELQGNRLRGYKVINEFDLAVFQNLFE